MNSLFILELEICKHELYVLDYTVTYASTTRQMTTLRSHGICTYVVPRD